jgi:hypothetical protein
VCGNKAKSLQVRRIVCSTFPSLPYSVCELLIAACLCVGLCFGDSLSLELSHARTQCTHSIHALVQSSPSHLFIRPLTLSHIHSLPGYYFCTLHTLSHTHSLTHSLTHTLSDLVCFHSIVYFPPPAVVPVKVLRRTLTPVGTDPTIPRHCQEHEKL